MKTYHCECGVHVTIQLPGSKNCPICQRVLTDHDIVTQQIPSTNRENTTSANDTDKEARSVRIQQMKERKLRLLSWLRFFRISGEIGIGDTTARIIQLTKKDSDVHQALTRLLQQCACKQKTAVTYLNELYPY